MPSTPRRGGAPRGRPRGTGRHRVAGPVDAAGPVGRLFATFGAITAIFQWGWLGAVFGVHDPGPILSFLPTILIGILFGVAMDYRLFLVSGVREAYAHGAPARLARPRPARRRSRGRRPWNATAR